MTDTPKPKTVPLDEHAKLREKKNKRIRELEDLVPELRARVAELELTVAQLREELDSDRRQMRRLQQDHQAGNTGRNQGPKR